MSCIENKAIEAIKDHRAREAKAKEIEEGTSSHQTLSITSRPVVSKLPETPVTLDDVGKIRQKKVPFVRPITWDVWDQNAPSSTYETLGHIMRSSLYPGQ